MKSIKLACRLAPLLAFAMWPAAAATPAPGATPTATADEATSAQWADIKDHSFEKRPEFFAGLKRLEAKLEAQIRELVAKRATMTGITDTREWDFAMKELESAQSYLKSVGAEATKASRETWDQAKDRVGRAWVSTQDAYGKVKSSTTT